MSLFRHVNRRFFGRVLRLFSRRTFVAFVAPLHRLHVIILATGKIHSVAEGKKSLLLVPVVLAHEDFFHCWISVENVFRIHQKSF